MLYITTVNGQILTDQRGNYLYDGRQGEQERPLPAVAPIEQISKRKFFLFLLPPGEIGAPHMERSMHVYTLTQFNSEADYNEPAVIGYYASKRKAEAKAVELSAKQAKEEEEDWIKNPCECGERNCDYRDRFFEEWRVDKFDLAELSMRQLMKIELADADQD